MEIASRLKEYIDSMGIQTSQFADACGIPRPSLSQLLNGRNKKVSDKVIRQIHEAFPSLSVLWLLLGEGPMLNGENIQFSEPQNHENEPDFAPQEPTYQPDSYDDNGLFTNEIFPSKKNPVESTPIPQVRSAEKSIPVSNFKSQQATVSVEVGSRLKVKNIMVVYCDGSVELFVPEVSPQS